MIEEGKKRLLTYPNHTTTSVNPYQGLFFFDSGFRPVPLEQHFLGIKGKPNSVVTKERMDKACYDKVWEMVEQGHQVMVFVHARKETVRTAQALREEMMAEGVADFFDCSQERSYSNYKREVEKSRNKELKELFKYGFGIHHAGMLRSDRTLTERMFADGAIKVTFINGGSYLRDTTSNTHFLVGAMLHSHACLGRQLACLRSSDQRHAGL